MNWLFAIVIISFSPSLKAQTLCGPKISKFNCDMTISTAISNKNNKLLEQLVAKKGVKAFFDYVDPNGYYQIVEDAQIFNNSAFVAMITSRPDFSKDIIDKNRFLKIALRPGDHPYIEPVIVNALFNNKDKSKNLNWFERRDWPYPMLNMMKEKNVPELIKRLDRIDELKNNLCQVNSVDKLLATEKEFPDFKLGLKYPENDLLSCATKAGNNELVAYLIKEKLFYPQNLPKLISYFESSPMNDQNQKLFKQIATQMRDSKIPFPASKLKQNAWTISHWDGSSDMCQLQNDSTLMNEAQSFLDLSEKLIWLNYLQYVRKLKAALAQNDAIERAKAIKGIISLIKESGLSINYQDQDGKSIMHHLAEFADFKTIEAIEWGLNNAFVTMDTTLQDKNGNTPFHVALLSNNIEGSSVLADLTSPASDGFSSPLRGDVLMKNHEGKTPEDLAKNLTGIDKNKKKEIQEWIKRHAEDLKQARSKST